MIGRILGLLLVVVAIAFVGLWLLGRGAFITPHGAGTPTDQPIPRALIEARAGAQSQAAEAAGVRDPQQILFGDLHVHSTFSFDAFMMSLPLSGGDGAHPIADACDYARYCSALDFWSINDHALASTPQRWRETVEGIRQCNAVSGDYASPDTVAYLGWEWTQVGNRPENHWGHKNVILRDLEDGKIPTRPIAAAPPGGMEDAVRSAPTLQLGVFAAYEPERGGREFARYMQDMLATPACPSGVSVHDLPDDCREAAKDPSELFAKLDEWGIEATVIPHGTTWGYYTPLGSSWDKQLTPEQHDPARQRLVEVMSGHGNSEEYRSWKEVEFAADGSKSCPRPTLDFTPGCWRAGEIIGERCAEAGVDEATCAQRVEDARQNFVDADLNGGAATVPAYTVADWLDAGQCRDCFQPSFNYRPKSSVQYMMALSRESGEEDPLRFRFGFMASSDNHSARPGTGYKEVSRAEFTETRFGNFGATPLGVRKSETPDPISKPFDASTVDTAIFGVFESERQASFFLNGGLVAVHAESRDRNSIYDALKNRQVYGTSGPRTLLWFDLLNAPGTRERTPMGSQTSMSEAPIFEVRAVGSFEQKPGCPEYSTNAMSPERIERVCQGECYNPSDTRRQISRIEVVRIRPQRSPNEDVSRLIDDPWRSFECQDDRSGCRVVFSDDEFRRSGRDALYYVRAIEESSPAVQADPLRCERDEQGNCVDVDPCFTIGGDIADDCLAPTEERAWSSPIFVDHSG
jgi:hypothetical protein